MPAAKLYDSNMVLIQNIIIQDVTKKTVSRNIVHDLATINQDIVQNMGRKLPVYVFKGINYNATSDVLRSLPGSTGYFEFQSEAFNVPLTQIYFEKIDFKDKGERPVEREFILNAISFETEATLTGIVYVIDGIRAIVGRFAPINEQYATGYVFVDGANVGTFTFPTNSGSVFCNSTNVGNYYNLNF
jgi:hypothetical protein